MRLSPSHLIWLVSDRAEWFAHALAGLTWEADPGQLAIVHRGWSGVTPIGDHMPRLIWWDVARRSDRVRSILSEYASGSYQHISLLCLDGSAGEPGSALAGLAGLGYGRVCVAAGGSPCALGHHARGVLRSPLYLLPPVLRALGGVEGSLARAYAALLCDPAGARTVEGWGRMLGYGGRHAIEELHRRHGMPRPWALLGWLRLLAAVDWAIMAGGEVRPRDVAARFKYSSPKYLNRHARRLSGHGFRELVAIGPGGMLELMAVRLRED